MVYEIIPISSPIYPEQRAFLPFFHCNLWSFPCHFQNQGLVYIFHPQGSSLDVARSQRGPPENGKSLYKTYITWVFMGYHFPKNP